MVTSVQTYKNISLKYVPLDMFIAKPIHYASLLMGISGIVNEEVNVSRILVGGLGFLLAGAISISAREVARSRQLFLLEREVLRK